jgi:alpha-glucosidase
MAYYGSDGNGLLRGVQLPFNFQLISAEWQAQAIDRIVRGYEAALPAGAAPNWVIGNHDKPRIASRVGEPRARLAAMLLLTLRGTPTLYYGDELGMTDATIPADEVQDPFERNEPGKGLGRDPQRTPMQWSDAPHAGFTSGTPWLRLGDNWPSRNVDFEARDPGSMLDLYRRLIALRRRERALHEGRYEAIDAGADVLAYARTYEGRRIVVVLNFGSAAYAVPPAVASPDARMLVSTRFHNAASGKCAPWVVQPLEGVILG